MEQMSEIPYIGNELDLFEKARSGKIIMVIF